MSKYGKYIYEMDTFEGEATSGEAGVFRNFQKSSSKAMEGWELVSHEVSWFNYNNNPKKQDEFLQVIIWKKAR